MLGSMKKFRAPMLGDQEGRDDHQLSGPRIGARLSPDDRAGVRGVQGGHQGAGTARADHAVRRQDPGRATPVSSLSGAGPGAAGGALRGKPARRRPARPRPKLSPATPHDVPAGDRRGGDVQAPPSR